jgi:hypothetical protein
MNTTNHNNNKRLRKLKIESLKRLRVRNNGKETVLIDKEDVLLLSYKLLLL